MRITRETLIMDLPASNRLKNALLKDCWAPPRTLGQIEPLERTDKTLGGVLDRGNWETLLIPNFGMRCRDELKQILNAAGLR
jgi:hypothetical protein